MVHKQLVLYSLYSIEAYLLSNSIFGQQYNNYYCLASQSSNLLLQPNMDPVRVCVCTFVSYDHTHTARCYCTPTKNKFFVGININLGAYEDPHAIAGALKLYFRELPIPLIPFDNYDLVLIAASKWKLHACMRTCMRCMYCVLTNGNFMRCNTRMCHIVHGDYCVWFV